MKSGPGASDLALTSTDVCPCKPTQAPFDHISTLVHEKPASVTPRLTVQGNHYAQTKEHGGVSVQELALQMLFQLAGNSPWFFITFGVLALTSLLPTDMFAERSWKVMRNPPVRGCGWVAGALTHTGLRDTDYFCCCTVRRLHPPQVDPLFTFCQIPGPRSQQKAANMQIFWAGC